MAHVDPARTKKRTKQEIIKDMQDACKKIPCSVAAAKGIKCPFCPWHKLKGE